jgi:carnitine 3-dehydrogenase
VPLASQSNAQSGEHGIRDLERIRDRNLAGILRALDANDRGAGRTVAALTLQGRAPIVARRST